MFFILVAVLFVAGGGAYYWLLQSQQRAAAEAEVVVEAPRPTEVYAPATTLAPGMILKPTHLATLPIKDADLTPEMVLTGPEGEAALLGSVVTRTMHRGAPIARSAVVQPGDRGFLAAVLPQGKRAISIPITETAGISGLVLPGDRVDIILTYSLTGASIDAERDVRASETVLGNIRVLALDQRLRQTEAAEDGGPASTAPPIARTATLQVSPREAEMLTLATSLGDLSMVLNSVHDGGDAAEAAEANDDADAPRRMTLDSDVTSLLQRQGAGADGIAEPLAARLLRIQIVRGANSGAIELGEESGSPPPTATAAADPAFADPDGLPVE